jgi:plastocyanin
MSSYVLLMVACGGDSTPPTTPTPPIPEPPPSQQVTATAYILPGAVNLGTNAFGDHAVLIYKGERLRWVNADSSAHALVADTASLPEFLKTDTLGPGGEQSFVMSTTGTTTFHCTIHPGMVGALEVRDR